MNEIIEEALLQRPYVKDFMEAIRRVEQAYVYYPYGMNDEQRKYSERIFAYELYHQFRSIMDDKDREADYKGVLLNGEQLKGSWLCERLAQCAPDQVLHKAINKVSEQTQLLLCEIKMRDNTKALDDLVKIKEKLARLKFQTNVFLYVGVTYEEFKAQLQESTTWEEYDPNTVCITFYRVKGEEDEISLKSLQTIMDEITKKAKLTE